MSGETGLENRSNIYGIFGVLYQNDQPKSNSKAEKSHAICTCVTFEFQKWIWQTVLKLSNCIEMFTFDSLLNIVGHNRFDPGKNYRQALRSTTKS